MFSSFLFPSALCLPFQAGKLVVSFADIPAIREKLPQMSQQLDVCQRALSDFLEDKRSSFPRYNHKL